MKCLKVWGLCMCTGTSTYYVLHPHPSNQRIGSVKIQKTSICVLLLQCFDNRILLAEAMLTIFSFDIFNLFIFLGRFVSKGPNPPSNETDPNPCLKPPTKLA